MTDIADSVHPAPDPLAERGRRGPEQLHEENIPGCSRGLLVVNKIFMLYVCNFPSV
jgi:hypothetical protein